MDVGEKITARKVSEGTKINFSLRTIQRYMKDDGMIYSILKSSIALTPEHQKNRYSFAKKLLEDGISVSKIIFSDEKSFSCNGPDGFKSWMPKNSPIKRKKWVMGGGSIMVWGCVVSNGNIFLQKIDGTLNSEKYIHLLKEIIVSWINGQNINN